MIPSACIKIVTICAIFADSTYLLYSGIILKYSRTIYLLYLIFLLAHAFCAQAIENIHLHGIS